jgi:biopolymer transport protein ExbD
MGMNVGGGKGGPKSDINVTPLVDIVLVLLIIFMVTMPVLMRNITIEIPRKLEADEYSPTASTQIVVCAKADGTVIVNDGSGDQSVNRIELAKTVGPLLDKKKTEKVVFVTFEDDIVWGDAVGVMDTLHGLGQIVDPKARTRDVKLALKTPEPGKTDPCGGASGQQ